MKKRWKFLCVAAVVGLLAGSLQAAAPSPNFKVFLCFGQSNMSGGTQVGMDAESQKTNTRIKVLGFATASCGSVSRTANKWSDASEPMHCGDGINPYPMGPSYAFGQALIDSLPATDTIGLIPAGLWGVAIEMFMKGGNYTGTKPSISGIGNCAWDWMVTKCQTAMQRGVFSGIILEQGESNTGDGDGWLTKVKTIYNDLKTTLPLDKDIPFVAGELLQTASGTTQPCCASLDTTIDKIPKTLPFGYVASSKGLNAGGDQKNYHFDQAGYRTLGQRFAQQMLIGLRKVGTLAQQQHQRIIPAASLKSQRENIKVYSLSGRFISTGAAMNNAKSFKPGNIYIVSSGATGSAAKLMIAPAQR